MKPARVIESLNQGHHAVLERDPRVLLVGEDLLDPYGGAFRASQGLSTRFPDRVLTTPLSEQGFVGLACGLALAGERPIVEIMFGDFIALAFDPLLNFATKSVTMYGRRVPMHLVVRCPVGGNRAYGPTHSQSLQKHFLGIPNLELYELSPFDEGPELLARLLDLGRPAILFENKVLYTQRVLGPGPIDDLFVATRLDDHWTHVRLREPSSAPPRVLLTPGGVFHRALGAARRLFLERELDCELLVPSRLYPLRAAPVMGVLQRARAVYTVEEGPPGGAWGEAVAQVLRVEGVRAPVRCLTSRDSIIPAAPHLERSVLLQADDVFTAIAEGERDVADHRP